MKPNKSYGIFAEYYDILTQNIDYRKRAEYFNTLIKQSGGKQCGLLLDLACGTGSLSEAMDDLGYDVIAVDSSPEMLGIAMDKKFESGKNIQYVCQDMRELDLYGGVDITICALDSLNHLDNFDDLKTVFSKVFTFTNPEGLFIFDINTEFKHKTILGEHTFIYDTDEVYCVWQNSCENSKVKIDLDFFVPENEKYSRYSESFYENAYSIEDIKHALENTGFRVLNIYDEDSFEPLKENSQRAVFVTQK
ncbi:class I SAM-dependent DNA methyltransferase [Porcipelethomonas sp.]|uniref:class I SAM-dependent DNA methyltransferase n=1 Tax=Porcipelethomonas sp. TaxID=2981675 RepID=UPI003EF9438E